jgi:hypothetical protein
MGLAEPIEMTAPGPAGQLFLSSHNKKKSMKKLYTMKRIRKKPRKPALYTMRKA